MIMTIDIGNTDIVFGFYNKDEIKYKWHIESDTNKDVNEYNKLIMDLLKANNISRDEITGISMLSVVPSLRKTIKQAIAPLNKKTISLGSNDIKTGINIKIDNPGQAGEDLIANAIAGKYKFKKDFIIIDFGTATTFQISDQNGDFIGGAIAPGIETTFKSLYDSAALLPEVDIYSTKTTRVIGKNTIDAMKAGIYFGFIGGAKEIISRMKKEYGKNDMAICLTGGLSKILNKELGFSYVIDENLTLYGLKLLWDMNK